MWPQIFQANLAKEVPEVKVPVYFCIGRHDYNTPFELAEKYFNQLEAPKKELIWFEESAHSPLYEEPDKFNDLLINHIRNEN
jgi:pimeloyl-ACP methyl ester carboxylesterase